MAFVNEKIGERWQTVDHRKNIFLQKLGAKDSGGLFRFILNYQGSVVNFEAKIKTGPIENKKYDVTWDVVSFDMPEDLNDQTEAVLESLGAALRVHGIAASCDNIKDVTVNFITPIFGRG